MTLTLGGILFQDFEIPEQINFGGRQSLTTHRLPGGARVVDAMGRDDDDIRWSGRFRSASAGRRARSLDFLRAAGKPVTLAWDAFRYTVVVSEFQADFRQAYEIPYAVSCHVVTPSQDPLPGLADLLLADASAAFGLSATLTVAGLADAVGDVPVRRRRRQGAPGRLPRRTRGGRGRGRRGASRRRQRDRRRRGRLGHHARRLRRRGERPGRRRLAVERPDFARRQPRPHGRQRAGIPVTVVTVAGGDLYRLALQYLGSAEQWNRIAEANGLIDPVLTGLVTLLIPRPDPTQGGGVYRFR